MVDRYHCTYFTAAMLAERGVDLLTRQHQRRLTDFRQGERLGRRDRLVTWLRPHRPKWMDAETYARMTAHLIGAISLLKLPIRPGRVEPHAIKRRPNTHALLTVPRHVARANILRSRPALA